jgi:mannosyltransferase
MPEVVADGDTGYVVPPNDPRGLRDAIERIANDPEAADAMGARGRARIAATFTWPEVARRCFDRYRR